jgi:hypothetical protein
MAWFVKLSTNQIFMKFGNFVMIWEILESTEVLKDFVVKLGF